MPGEATEADAWWADLPADRRAQLHRWITQRAHHLPEHVDGQLDALTDHLSDLNDALYDPDPEQETDPMSYQEKTTSTDGPHR